VLAPGLAVAAPPFRPTCIEAQNAARITLGGYATGALRRHSRGRREQQKGTASLGSLALRTTCERADRERAH
jgi:hypothetical protein